LTADAVAEFQRARGLTVTGTVDEPTAVALGVHRRADASVEPRPVRQPNRGSREPEAPVRSVAGSVAADRTVRASLGFALGAPAVAVVAALLLLRRRRTPTGDDERKHHGPATPGDWYDAASVIVSQPYDYEQESQLVS
jgi:hypothetical protein